MRDLRHRAAHRGAVLTLHDCADAAEAQGAQYGALARSRADGRAHLLDAQLLFFRHVHQPIALGSEAASAPPFVVADSAAASTGAGRSADSPRCVRAAWLVRRRSSPAKVAFTTLCGLVEPKDLVRMSWMPAVSITARTGPPAITPVPSDAGRSSTRPAP